MELYARAAELDNPKARYNLARIYGDGGDLKKAKFHYEVTAMAGHDVARFLLGMMKHKLGNMEQAVRQWVIAASAGSHQAMQSLQIALEVGNVSRDEIDST